MSLSEKKAHDIMRKASGCELIEKSVIAIPHGFAGLLVGQQELICVTEGACGFADRLECIRDEYKYGVRLRTAKVSDRNSHVLRLFIKWTAPKACTNEVSSIALEDEFGYALPLLAAGVGEDKVKPVLMSSPDLVQNLAAGLGRTAWQALAAGLSVGYGAEFAYAQNESEIMNALLAGYTGIVIDCREKLVVEANELSVAEVKERFGRLPDQFRESLVASYVGKEFSLGQTEKFTYELDELGRLALVYGEAIAYLQYVYSGYFKNAPWPVDFILYLGEDELAAKAQYLLANELMRAGVKLVALQLSLTSKAITENVLVAKALGHKLRVLVCEENKHALADVKLLSGGLWDIRPIKGQGLLDAASVLLTANDPLAAKLLPGKDETTLADTCQVEAARQEILTVLQKNREEIGSMVRTKYEQEYKQLLIRRVEEEKALLDKLQG